MMIRSLGSLKISRVVNNIEIVESTRGIIEITSVDITTETISITRVRLVVSTTTDRKTTEEKMRKK